MTGILRALLLLAASALAHAQLAAPIEAALLPDIYTTKWSEKALTADVMATAKVRVPWGVIESIEHGKYWRNGKGQIRQDDQHGLSILLDLREPNKRTLIDSRLKVINQDDWPEALLNGGSGTTRMSEVEKRSRIDHDWDPLRSGRELTIRGDLVDQFVRLRSEHVKTASVEGIEVKIYQLPYGPGTMEWWVSHELKFVLVTKYVTEAAEFEQRYHNIRLQKSPDSVFELPVEYSIRVVNKGNPVPWGDANWNMLKTTDVDLCFWAFRFSDGLTGKRSKKEGVARAYNAACAAPQ